MLESEDSSSVSSLKSVRDGKNNEDSSEGESLAGDGDFDITILSEKEAWQVLNDEVSFSIHIL